MHTRPTALIARLDSVIRPARMHIYPGECEAAGLAGHVALQEPGWRHSSACTWILGGKLGMDIRSSW